MDFQEILEEAKNDPSLLAQLDLDEIFDGVDTPSYLETTSFEEIHQRTYQVLRERIRDADQIAEFSGKLADYRVIDEVFEIQMGKYIRYIPLNKEEFTFGGGGVVVDIRFLDSGTQILCKNRNRFFQIKFDQHLVFQKLSFDEQLFLMVKAYLAK